MPASVRVQPAADPVLQPGVFVAGQTVAVSPGPASLAVGNLDGWPTGGRTLADLVRGHPDRSQHPARRSSPRSHRRSSLHPCLSTNNWLVLGSFDGPSMPPTQAGGFTAVHRGRRPALVAAVARCVEATGDAAMLDRPLPFLDGPALEPGQTDLYLEPRIGATTCP